MKINQYETIRLHSKDNVVVSRREIEKGCFIKEENITLLHKIQPGYKIATRYIRNGEPIIKYGNIIGYATENICPGASVHNHNMKYDKVDRDLDYCNDYASLNILNPKDRHTFKGYKRPDGKVGTRNFIGVFAVGNCGASVTRKIANYFTAEKLSKYCNVDGVVPFVHEMGCGMEMTGEPMDLLRRTISGYIRNPNMAASIVVSLGCERNNIDSFLERQDLKEGTLLKKLVIQEEGGTSAAVEKGIRQIIKMLPVVNKNKRVEVSAEHIVLGLQCGGSDGFSGLSANPALGNAVEHIVRNNGTAILSETTEIFGGEHILTRKATSPEVADKLIRLLDWWLEYTKGRDCQINGTVSPGNNKGGITNILEKSLGSVKKGGEAPLNEVYHYAELITAKGLVFMDTPGYDPVSVTGQIAGGANLIAFTTGRGSCFGSVPTPTIKIVSNTPVYLKMKDDMDINCGSIIDGNKTIYEMGEYIFQQILKTASGEKTRSELLGVGEDEFVPWNIGVTA